MDSALVGTGLIGLALNPGQLKEKFAAEMESVKMEADGMSGHLSSVGSSIAGFATKALLFSAGTALAASGYSIKAAKDFQQAMTLLQTQAGYSAKDVDSLRSSVLQLAKDTGTGPDELAAGMYHIASAGIPAAKAIDVLRIAAEGAKIGNANLEDVTNALTASLKSYGPAGGNAAQTMDLLNKTVGEGNMRMGDLASSIGVVLPVAARAGISLGEVGANIATMTQKGVDGHLAVTSLQAIIMGLEVPGAKAVTALKDIGMSADGLRKEIREKGLAAAIGDLDKKTHGNIDTLHDLIPNIRALRDQLGVTGTSAADYAKNLDGMNHASDAGNNTASAWARTQEDAAIKMDKGITTVKVYAIEFGTRLLPLLGAAIPVITDLAGKGFGVLNSALDYLPGIINALKPVVSGLGSVFQFLGGHMTAVKVVLGAMVGLWATVRTAMAIQAVIQGVSAAWGFMSGVLALVTTGEASAATAADELALSEVAALLPILAVIAAVAALVGIGYLLVTHWGQLKSMASTVGAAIKNGVGAAFGFLQVEAGKLLGWLKSNWPILLAIITGPFGLMVYFVVTHFQQIKNAIGAAFRWIISEAGHLPEQIGMVIGFILVKFVTLTVGLMEWAVTTLPMFLASVVEFLMMLPFKFAVVFDQVLLQLLKWGFEALAWVATAIPKFVMKVSEFVSHLPGDIFSIMMTINDKLDEWVKTAIEWAATAIPKFVASLNDQLGKLGDNAWKIGKAIVEGIWNGMSAVSSWLTDKVNGFMGGLVGGAMKAIGARSPSTVFADKVGAPIAQGIGVGIGVQMPAVAASLKAQLGGLAGMARSAAGGGPLVGAAGQSSRNVVNNRTVNMGGITLNGANMSPSELSSTLAFRTKYA